MDRIELIVSLLGDDAALRSLAGLKKAADELNNRKIDLTVEKTSIDRQISVVRRELDALVNKRREVKIDGGDVSKLDKQIVETREKLSELTAKRRDIVIDSNINTEGLRQARSLINDMERDAYSLRDALSGIGDALSGVGSVFSSIGGMFSGGNILDYAVQELTHMATRAFTGDIKAATNRYDILDTYSDYMGIMGVNAEKADASLSKLNDSIQGLPIGLDEGAFQIRKYNMYLDDVERATDLAIGLDKALIAGGASEQMRTTSKYELDRLLAVGELATKRQWNAMIQGLGVSVEYLKEQMGYAELSTKEFVAALSTTAKQAEEGAFRITPDEFLAGIEGLADSRALDDALDIYRRTIESGMSSVQFALTRGKANILEALNDTLKDVTGKNIPDMIMSFRDQLNEMFSGISDWIRNNPDAVEGALDRIQGLFQRIKDFDWASLAESIGNSVGKFFDILTWIYDRIPNKAIEGFVTFGLVWASPLGRAFSVLGSIFKTMAKIPWPGAGLLGKISSSVGGLGKTLGSWSDIGKGFVGASAFVGVIAEIGLVVAEYAKVAEYIGQRDLGNLDKNIGPVLKLAGEMTAVAGGITALMTGLQKLGLGKDILIGEGLTAGLTAVIGFVGIVVGKFAEVAETISGVNLDNLDANWTKLDAFMGKITVPISTMVAAFSALTALTGGAGGLAVAAGEGLTGGLFLVIDKAIDTVDRFVNVADKVSGIKLPSDGQMSKLGEVFASFQGIVNAIDIDYHWWERSSFKRAMDSVNDIVNNIGMFEVAESYDLDTDAITRNLTEVVESIGEVSQAISDAFDGITSLETSDQEDITANMTGVLENIGAATGVLNTIKDEIGQLGIALDENGELLDHSVFDDLKNRVKEVGRSLGEIYVALNEAFGGSSKWEVWGSENQATIVANMNSALSQLNGTVAVFDVLDDQLPKIGAQGLRKSGRKDYYTDQFQKTVEALKEVAIGAQSVTNTISSNWFSAIFDQLRTNLQGDTVKNMNTSLSGIGDIINTVSSLDVSKLGIGTDVNIRDGSDAFSRKMGSLQEMLKSIGETMGALTDKKGPFKWLFQTNDSVAQALTLNNLTTAIGNIGLLVTNVKSSINAIATLDDGELETAIPQIEGLFNQLDQMMQAISETSIGKGQVGEVNFYQMTDDMNQLKEAMGHIVSIVAEMKGMMSNLEAISKDEGTFKLGQLIRGITTSLNAIPDNAAEITERAANIMAAIDSVKGLMQSIVDMKGNMDAIAKEDATGQMQGILNGIVTALGGPDIEGIKTNLAEMNSMVGNIQTNLSNLAAVDLSALNEAVSTLQGYLEPLNSALSTCQDMLMRVATNAANAKSNISALGAMAQAKQSQILNFTGHISALSSVLGTASGRASALGAAIRGLQDKTVTVTYNEVRNVSTNNVGSAAGAMRTAASRLAGVFRANGGIVPQYRAIGGMMRPKGTDTVPAMLTPGEFVMRRAAVQRLGLDFMERINRMDIPGAISALMRGVRVPGGGGITYNNQRTYDNHATINQYFPKGKKDKRASYRRASRALSAL